MKKGYIKSAALKYRHGIDNAPKLVAKGKGKVAEEIVKTAQSYGIPVKEDRELIEFLSALDLYKEIPPELYRAVAEILAFVYYLNSEKKDKGA